MIPRLLGSDQVLAYRANRSLMVNLKKFYPQSRKTRFLKKAGFPTLSGRNFLQLFNAPFFQSVVTSENRYNHTRQQRRLSRLRYSKWWAFVGNLTLA
jgi:hypothetical protein